MPARVRVLLLSGHSCSHALLRLLGGLLSGARFSGGTLLGLLSSDGLLSGGGFGSRALLRLLSGLLPSGSFSRRTLLRSKIRRR
jgi:hypothetical protein